MKAKADDFFRAGDFLSALSAYTSAIDCLDGDQHLLMLCYTNRSNAFFKMDMLAECKRDCSDVASIFHLAITNNASWLISQILVVIRIHVIITLRHSLCCCILSVNPDDGQGYNEAAKYFVEVLITMLHLRCFKINLADSIRSHQMSAKLSKPSNLYDITSGIMSNESIRKPKYLEIIPLDTQYKFDGYLSMLNIRDVKDDLELTVYLGKLFSMKTAADELVCTVRFGDSLGEIRLNEAICIYNYIIYIFPLNTECLSNRSVCKLLKRDFQGCIDDCTSILAIRGVDFHDANQELKNKFSIKYMQAYLISTNFHFNLKALCRRGIAFMQLESPQCDNAKSDYDEAIRLETEDLLLQNDYREIQNFVLPHLRNSYLKY